MNEVLWLYITSASIWAAAMHLSAPSLVLNCANAQPGKSSQKEIINKLIF